MSRRWVVRTDVRHLDDVILPSLAGGELRQGWGWRDDQDLNIVGPLFNEKGREALNDAQRATWSRVQHFWPEHWQPVCEGDLILLPKVPKPGRWALMRITGPYRYEIHRASGDYGHILPVETVVSEIAPENAAVDAGLVRTMRCSQPMWSIDHLSGSVDKLLATDADVARVDSDSVRLRGVLDSTLDKLLQDVREGFQANQLERPVYRLLTLVFDDAAVEDLTGRGEHGADFYVSETDRFGIDRSTVVQLKDHDPLNDIRALEQVEEAFEHYRPSAAVIIATAHSEDASFEKARVELSERLGIPVTTVLGRELAQWFLAHLEALATD